MRVLESIQNALGLNTTANQELGNLDYNRITFQPNTAKPGDLIHIHYLGLLKDAGANEMYLHYAFDSWNAPIRTIKMGRQNNGNFDAAIQAEENHEINFCFKDSANHWDNNNGWNWTLPLQ